MVSVMRVELRHNTFLWISGLFALGALFIALLIGVVGNVSLLY